MPLVPLSCIFCGANLTVDSTKDAAICEYCGKPYIVKDAIVNNYIKIYVNQVSIHADAVNITTQKDFDIKAGKLIKYLGEKQNVTIPDTVFEIGDRAFEGLNVTTVRIPQSVIKIGEDAFSQCKQLKNIELPDSIKEIAPRSFYNSGLVSISIPKSVAKVGAYAFRQCKWLKDVNISELTDVEIGAFYMTPYWGDGSPCCGAPLRSPNIFEMRKHKDISGTGKVCTACKRFFSFL